LGAEQIDEAGDLDDPLREEFEYLVVDGRDLGLSRPVIPV
jgi:hypothetical protein